MNELVVSVVLVVALGSPSAAVFGAEPAAVESAGGRTATRAPLSPLLPGDVIARVNGVAITRAEVDRTIRIFLARTRASHDLSPDARKQAEDAALEQLIGAKLLYLTGSKFKIPDLDKQVAEKMAQARAKFSSPAEYEGALQANNLTEQEAQDMVRNDIVAANLIDREVMDKIVVSESDAKKYYDQNQEKFSKPESLRLAHILVEVTSQATPEEKRKAWEKAESIRQKLLTGADFAAMAKTDSSCPSKEQGGDLGFFGAGEMIPEFETAVTTLTPGEISTVVETRFGYHILKLVEKKSAAVEPFGEAKEKIGSYLKQTRAQQAIIDYVAELKRTAAIEMTAAK